MAGGYQETREGDEALIKKSFLINARTGQRVNVKPDATYTFTMESTREGFWWLVGRNKPD